LLFLVKDHIGNDAVWRAFFQAAARLKLHPHLAAAAADAAQRNSKARISDVIGSKGLHPDIGTYQPWAYPGYRIQHGFASGADPPPWRDHFAADQAAAVAPASAQVQSMAASTASGSSTPELPGHNWEAERLRRVQELQEASRLQRAHAGTAGTSAQTAVPAPQQALWSPFRQLSTMQQALEAAAMRRAVHSTPQALGGQRAEQIAQWHTDHQRCLVSPHPLSRLCQRS
jgi:hypothetical protein